MAAFFKDMSKIQEEARVLIVSPVRNEAAHIARVARAVASQSRTPARWIVIDDSSTDGTYELLEELEQEIDFMTVMRPPGGDSAAGPRDRLAQAVEVRNFNLVLEGVELEQFTHLMKLDGTSSCRANTSAVCSSASAPTRGWAWPAGRSSSPSAMATERS